MAAYEIPPAGTGGRSVFGHRRPTHSLIAALLGLTLAEEERPSPSVRKQSSQHPVARRPPQEEEIIVFRIAVLNTLLCVCHLYTLVVDFLYLTGVVLNPPAGFTRT